MTWRTYGGGGGRNFSGGDRTFTLTFPGFRGAVRVLVLINVAVFFGILLLRLAGGSERAILGLASLIPVEVMHGYVWQVVTYSFLHLGFWHIAGNMFQLWMFGTALEDIWGKHRFYEFYFLTVVGAAIFTIIVAYTGVFGMSPITPVAGASGGIMAILIAFGILFAEQQIFLFPFPISIKAKYFVIILVLINLAGALDAATVRGALTAYATHLGGALCGFLYVKFMPRQGMRFLASERYYGLRNSYYRWKRRRAARKFEVYMRKHDSGEHFDQYGNYRPPEDKEKGNGEGGRGDWVN